MNSVSAIFVSATNLEKGFPMHQLNSYPNASFYQIMPRPFIVHGVGESGYCCYNYLCNRNLAGCIAAYTDSSADAHGRYFMSAKVESIDYCLEHPDYPVIITPRKKADEIYAELKTRGVKNGIYLYLSPYQRPINQFRYNYQAPVLKKHNELEDDPMVDDPEVVCSFYDKEDSYTREIIEAALTYRHTPCGCIQPFEESKYVLAKFFHTFTSYWSHDIERIRKESAVTFLDIGAYQGTFQPMFSLLGDKVKKVYAFEPDPNSYLALTKIVDDYSEYNERITCFNLACSDKKGEISFDSLGSLSSRVLERGGIKVKAERVDDLDLEVEGTLYIKMNIQGSELEALKGAENTIRKHKPRLCIAASHKNNHLYQVPELIRSILSDYKCIIRDGGYLDCYADVR